MPNLPQFMVTYFFNAKGYQQNKQGEFQAWEIKFYDTSYQQK